MAMVADSASAGIEPASDPNGDRPHVAILRWPDQAELIQRLRAAGTPRLLVVPPDLPAPEVVDCDEDWIRMPASDNDMRVRMAGLAVRATRHSPAPIVKGDGRIVFRERWVALAETEEAVVRVLADKFGDVVDADTLAGSVEPRLTGNAVRIQIMRLRARLRPLGLELRTVRNHGYVLGPLEGHQT